MTKHWRVLLVAVAIVFAVGCGDDDDNGGDPDSGYAALQGGAWESSCFVYDNSPQIFTLQFEGNHVDMHARVYGDGDTECSGDVMFSGTIGHEYSVGEEVTTASGLTAKEIDLKVTHDPQGIAEDDESYDIFKIDGSILYRGVGHGTQPEDRPDELDMDIPFQHFDDAMPNPDE